MVGARSGGLVHHPATCRSALEEQPVLSHSTGHPCARGQVGGSLVPIGEAFGGLGGPGSSIHCVARGGIIGSGRPGALPSVGVAAGFISPGSASRFHTVCQKNT